MGFDVTRNYATGIQAESSRPWAASYGLRRSVSSPISGLPGMDQMNRGVANKTAPLTYEQPIPPIPGPVSSPAPVQAPAQPFSQRILDKPISLSEGANLNPGQKARLVMPWDKQDKPSEFIEFTRSKTGLDFQQTPGGPTSSVSTGNQLVGMVNGIPIFR